MKKTPRPRSAYSYCQTRQKLRSLIQQAQQNTQLLEIVRKMLPDKISAHCIAARDKAGILILTTDSPAWASQLRFTSPMLLKKLTKNNFIYQKALIKVNLQMEGHRIIGKNHKTEQLSKESARYITDCVDTVKNKALKKALLKLSQNKQ